MTLPQTLHGQLFLLGFDRRKGRLDLDNQWRFGIALRAAVLTDLYRGGYLEDNAGCRSRVGTAEPADPMLLRLVDEKNQSRTWARVVVQDQVRDEFHVRQICNTLFE